MISHRTTTAAAAVDARPASASGAAQRSALSCRRCRCRSRRRQRPTTNTYMKRNVEANYDSFSRSMCVCARVSGFLYLSIFPFFPGNCFTIYPLAAKCRRQKSLEADSRRGFRLSELRQLLLSNLSRSLSLSHTWYMYIYNIIKTIRKDLSNSDYAISANLEHIPRTLLHASLLQKVHANYITMQDRASIDRCSYESRYTYHTYPESVFQQRLKLKTFRK